MNVEELLQQEQDYSFDRFTHQDAFDFSMNVLDIIKEEKLNNVRIRVRYEDDLVFQYLMNDKNGEVWLDRKEKTVMACQHASLYTFLKREDFQYMENNDEYVICGGGFPLIVGGEIKGVFCISGLDHQDDHNLIIKALKRMKDSTER